MPERKTEEMTPVERRAEAYIERLTAEGWGRDTAERYARRRYGNGSVK